MEPGDETILAEGRADYLGFSYYMSNTVRAQGRGGSAARLDGGFPNSVDNPYVDKSDWGWQIDPTGLRYALVTLYERYEVPLFIVENGFGAIDKLSPDGTCHDPYRIDYLRSHIAQMKKAVEEDGVDLMGYTPWGCIDLVSFTTGESKSGMAFSTWIGMTTAAGAGSGTGRTPFSGFRMSSGPMARRSSAAENRSSKNKNAGILGFQRFSLSKNLCSDESARVLAGERGGGSPPRVRSNALNALQGKAFSERSKDFSAAQRRESNGIF